MVEQTLLGLISRKGKIISLAEMYVQIGGGCLNNGMEIQI
jgi:hypothetical protein